MYVYRCVKTKMPARVTEVKCKRCRKVLFTEEATPLLTAHSEVRTGPTHSRCGTGAPEYCLYISEENMPDWIRDAIDKEYWIKGKIHCPHCHSRLGSFDFVSQTKCDCGECLPPPIRIIHCKVDRLSDTGSNLPFLPLPRIAYNPELNNLQQQHQHQQQQQQQPIQIIAFNRRGHVVNVGNIFAENNVANILP